MLLRGFKRILNTKQAWHSSNALHTLSRKQSHFSQSTVPYCQTEKNTRTVLPFLCYKNQFWHGKRQHSTDNKVAENAEPVAITYIDREGASHEIKGKVGDNVMYLAHRNDLDIEGACEASLACCTCHVYVENFFDKLGEIDEEEEDMLDLAPFLQENSRLSCQIILSQEIDGIIVRIPSATRNFYVDGHKPKPH